MNDTDAIMQARWRYANPDRDPLSREPEIIPDDSVDGEVVHALRGNGEYVVLTDVASGKLVFAYQIIGSGLFGVDSLRLSQLRKWLKEREAHRQREAAQKTAEG